MDQPNRPQATDLERFRGYLYVIARLHARDHLVENERQARLPADDKALLIARARSFYVYSFIR